MKATWKNRVIAESDNTKVVEGNHYFPKDSVKEHYLKESDTHSTCPWKGEASYFHVQIDSEIKKDAAWYYPDPKPEAAEIKDHIAFWKGIEVID
jgi:uncharacterized protein (DUF427 family)